MKHLEWNWSNCQIWVIPLVLDLVHKLQMHLEQIEVFLLILMLLYHHCNLVMVLDLQVE